MNKLTCLDEVLKLIGKGELNDEEKSIVIEYIIGFKGELKKRDLMLAAYRNCTSQNVTQRKFVKIEKQWAETLEKMNKVTPKEITIEKFSSDVFKNPIIKAATIKSILQINDLKEYKSFVSWSFLKGAIELLGNDEHSKDLVGLITLVSEQYEAINKNIWENYISSLDNERVKTEYAPFNALSVVEQSKLALEILNKIKEYRNVAPEKMKIMYYG